MFYLKNGGVDVGKRDGLIVFVVHAQVLEHGFDGDGELGNLDVHLEDLPIGTLQLDVRHLCGFGMCVIDCFFLNVFYFLSKMVEHQDLQML